MINFQYLELKDRPQFKDQRFDLSTPGISLILGMNAKTKSPNGVGKSYFFGELAEFLAGEAVRQDRVRKGSVAYGVKVGKDEYEFKRSFSPREVITVTENGKELKMDLEPAREFMRKVVPYGEQEVSSFLYLDLANGVHPLISGTTSSRKAFFRDFFNQIEYLGVLRKWVDGEASRLAAEAKRASDLTIELERFADLSDPKALQAEVKELLKKRDSFSDQLSKVTAAAALLARLAEMKKTDFGDAPELVSEWDTVENATVQVRARRKALRMMQEEAQEYADWVETNSELDAEIQAATTAAEEHEYASMKDPEKKLNSLQPILDGYKDAVQTAKTSAAKLADLVERLSSAIQDGRSAIRKANEQQGVCPVCGGEYEDKHVAKTITRFKADLAENKKALAKAEADLRSLEESVLPSDKKIKALEMGVESLSELMSLRKKLERLKRKAEACPPKPKVVVSKIEATLTTVNGQLASLESYSEFLDLKEKLKEYPREIRSMAKSSDLQEEFVRMNDDLNRKQIVLNSLEKDLALRTEMEAELEGLKKAVQQKKYVDILVQAFSRKNAEKEMISLACAMLAEQVNKYAKYVFTEDFSFSFEMESNFSILVQRNYGKKVPSVSDVRRLSGAEKRLFSLVLVVALLTFVPPKQRPNILVLDEPTATMGQDNKEAFVRFLPVLNKVIPHLIVITPLQPHDYAHLSPNVFTVVKNGSVSTIQKGIVDVHPKRGSRT
jgi:DNA repair exonuclease SbcCD ATPase subunit